MLRILTKTLKTYGFSQNDLKNRQCQNIKWCHSKKNNLCKYLSGRKKRYIHLSQENNTKEKQKNNTF